MDAFNQHARSADMNDVLDWVSNAANVADEKRFRQAVHTLLVALTQGANILPEMVMKGGALMAIRYRTERMTRDIDFSTQALYKTFAPSQEAFLSNLDRFLANASSALPYGLQMRVQSKKVKPRVEGTFQTLTITIGYAYAGETAQLKKLNAGNSSRVLTVDYSFNEQIHDIAYIKDDLLGVQAYGEFTLIAEKLRAYLQQVDRDRERSRDLYDLWFILKDRVFSEEEKQRLLEVIREKAKSRNITVTQASLDDAELIARARRGWIALGRQVPHFPAFEVAYGEASQFWRALPW
jgi:Nucleotidyl transferase AbiEii toxin, Type IV TA system